MTTKVLIAEDEPALAEILRYNLEAEGFQVVHAASGDVAEEMVGCERPDLVLLDWNLPCVSGIELCRRFRMAEATKELPIIMLTARRDEADRIRGLTTGADDYVVKPFSLPELMARTKVLLRRSSPSPKADVLRHGDIELDRIAQRVLRGTRKVNVGPTEFRLLEFLLESGGRVLTRGQVLDGVWGRATVIDQRTVDVHIGRLRKALIRGREPDPIRTVRGSGYALADQ